jgi:hypothetical protein
VCYHVRPRFPRLPWLTGRRFLGSISHVFAREAEQETGSDTSLDAPLADAQYGEVGALVAGDSAARKRK